MPRTLITTLYALPRCELQSWYGSINLCRHITGEAEEAIAEHAGVSTDEVEWTELEHGEFLTVGGEPVGFVEFKFIPALMAAE